VLASDGVTGAVNPLGRSSFLTVCRTLGLRFAHLADGLHPTVENADDHDLGLLGLVVDDVLLDPDAAAAVKKLIPGSA
jgi:hypothetical protein